MKTEIEESIIEHIRSLKEENAAEYGFSLEGIINAARERQEVSGRRVIRVNKGEHGACTQPSVAKAPSGG